MLKGKIALITGGSRGIGRAIALAMAGQGADVAILYGANEQAAGETCEKITQMGRNALACRCDVSSLEQVKEAVSQVTKELGAIDILVNCAGITRDGLAMTMKESDFDAVLDTNLKGSFHTIKCCYGGFLKKKAGRIINISSVSGIMGNAGQSNYSASKAGVIGLTKSIARELAPRGICCNAIAPGFIATDMTAELGDQNALMGMIPMKRMGTPEDVAALAVFLASEGAGYITGEVIRVDGGIAI